MGMTEENRKRLKSCGSGLAATPEYARIADLCAMFGLSRSGIYKLAAEGKIVLKKLNNATVGDCGSVRQHMASLPDAEIRVGQSRTAA